MTILRSIVLTIALLLGTSAAFAQSPTTTPTTLPAGMTQEQMDAVVSAITRSVLEKLKDEKTPARAPATATTDDADPIDVLMRQASGLVDAMPLYGRGIARFIILIKGLPGLEISDTLPADLELIEMTVRPAHRSLDRVVQLCERCRLADEQDSPNRRLNLSERDS